MVYREVTAGGAYLSTRNEGTADALDVQSSFVEQHAHGEAQAQANPFCCFPGGDYVFFGAVGFVAYVLLWKFGYCDGRTLNIRRIPGVKKLLRKTCQYDTFDPFTVLITVVAASGNFAKRSLKKTEYYVSIGFWYEVFKSRKSGDGVFNQTVAMDVPQGAWLCKIQLYQTGIVSDTLMGEYDLDVQKKLLDNPKCKERGVKYPLLLKRAHQGDVEVRFRVCSADGEQEDPVLEGLDEMAQPQLYEAVLDVVPEGTKNLSGAAKLDVLAKVCTGELVKKGGKGLGGPKEKFFKCTHMPVPDDTDDETPARSKNPKWLFCWWDNDKQAERKPDNPAGFCKLIKVTKVYPGRKDGEWCISYRDGKTSSVLELKCDGRMGRKKGAHVWIDAFTMLMHDAKKAKLESNKDKDVLKTGSAQDTKENWDNKTPQEKWDYWEKFFSKQGLTQEQLQVKKQQFMAEQGVVVPGGMGGAAKAPKPAVQLQKQPTKPSKPAKPAKPPKGR